MKVDKASEVIEKYSTKRFLSKGALREKSRQRSALGMIKNEKMHNSLR